jgi:uncharacterized protein (TIGR01319 family)
MAGLREPYAKRTVEGDLGLYHNLDTLAALTAETLPEAERADFLSGAGRLREGMSVPEGEEMASCQLALARGAVRAAVYRHAGRIEERRAPGGGEWIQRGKDLGGVKLVIGAGGPIAFSRDPRFALEGAAASGEAPDVLAPRAPEYMLDSEYILFAAGLMARSEPAKARRIAGRHLKAL